MRGFVFVASQEKGRHLPPPRFMGVIQQDTHPPVPYWSTRRSLDDGPTVSSVSDGTKSLRYTPPPVPLQESRADLQERAFRRPTNVDQPLLASCKMEATASASDTWACSICMWVRSERNWGGTIALALFISPVGRAHPILPEAPMLP